MTWLTRTIISLVLSLCSPLLVLADPATTPRAPAVGSLVNTSVNTSMSVGSSAFSELTGAFFPLATLQLSQISGPMLNFSESGEEPTLVYFWSVYCRSCTEALPTFSKIQNGWGTTGLRVLTVHLFEDNREKLLKAAKQFAPDLPVFLMPDEVKNNLRIHLLPTAILLHRNKEIARFVGDIDSGKIQEALDKASRVKESG